MVKQILRSIKDLSRDDLLSELSEEDKKTVYILMQVFNVLTFMTWMSSLVTISLVVLLLSPKQSLIDWSRDHKYLVLTTLIFFLYIPVSISSIISSWLNPVASSLYRIESLQAVSPKKIWILNQFIFWVSMSIFGFIASFS